MVTVAVKSRTLSWVLLSLLAGGSIAFAQSSAPAPDDEVVALIDGVSVTLSEVDRLIQPQLQQLYDRIYQLRLNALDRLILSMLMERDAREQGVDFETYYANLFAEADLVEEVPPESESPLALDRVEVRRRYRDILLRQRRAEALRELGQQLRTKARIQFLLRPDRLALAEVGPDDDPVRGSVDAPVTIIEFADYQCGSCRAFEPALRKLLEEFAGKVRLVYRDFPINDDPVSVLAAQASECARDQGLFWEYHDALYDHDGEISKETLLSLARDLGAVADPFSRCLDTSLYRTEVEKDKKDGRDAGVNSTPTFFVNGRVFSGPQSYEALRRMLRKLVEG